MTAPISTIDCRVYERQSCEVPTTCQPASAREMKELRWGATIVDISQGGLRMILQRRFERGTALAVELPGDGKRESSIVFVKVVHIKGQPDGTWSLGCKFVSDLGDDEVERLVTAEEYVLASAQKDEAQEEETPNADAEPDEEDLPANSSERIRSLTNVNVEVETEEGSRRHFFIKRLDVEKCWPMTAGTTLRISGRSANAAAWSFQIEVTHLCQDEEQWKLRSRLTPASGPDDGLQISRPGQSIR